MATQKIPSWALLYSLLPRHYKHVAGQSSLSPIDLARATALIKANNGAKVTIKNSLVTIHWPGQLGVDCVPVSLLKSAQGRTKKALLERVRAAQPSPLIPLVPPRFKLQEVDIHDVLTALNDHGIAIIVKESPTLENTDDESSTVLSLATLFSGGVGPQRTIYGSHFIVAAAKNAINVAYTTSKLCLHQDLPYYESSPGLQLLHCVRNDEKIKGGESTFIDGLDCAERFSILHPAHFKLLKSIHTCFEKVNYDRAPLMPVNMRFFRPIILTSAHNIVALNWSPPFENPSMALCDRSKLSSFMDARNAFSEFLHNEESSGSSSMLTMRLKQGEIVVFNNRRMLHGRNEFKIEEEAAERKLIGCYVSTDDWKSALASSMRFAADKISRRIGNGDLL